VPTPSLINLGINEKLKTGSYVYLIVSGLPLLVYPFFFLSFMMGIFDPRTGDEPLWALLITTTFQSVALGYPCVYVPCVYGAMSAAKNRDLKRETKYAKFAFYYFVFAIVLLVLWSLVSAH
jgi:hypothetical protein